MDKELSHSKHGQIQTTPPLNFLTKSEVIVGYLQQMALPSLWNRELTTEDYSLWDQVLGIYSIAAIRFAFENWITNGGKFPLPKDILPLCISHHEQEEAAQNYKPKRGERMDGGNAQVLAVWSMVIDRIADFKEKELPYQPLTLDEFEDMITKSKSGSYVPRKDSGRYFANGNAKYNRELTQFMQAFGR